MPNPFKRSAVERRPALRPPPGMQPLELGSDSGFELGEPDEDDDWEDSVQEFESRAVADPFAP